MKTWISVKTMFPLLWGAVVVSGCTNQTTSSEVLSDSLQAESQLEPVTNTRILALIPGALEIGIPEGLNEKERKKGATEDSLFFEVEMGVNPMDLEFGIIINSAENLSLEQMEEQSLFISDEGKTYEHESGKKYRSQWYALPYVMERKFRLTTYKDDNDYSTLENDAKANGNAGLQENQTLSAFTNRYYIRFITQEAGKPRAFVMVLNLTVGC